MDNKGWDIWTNLAFKTQGYRKNFDLVTENENIITEHNGTISVLRIPEHQPPLTIGEFGFSTWNISLAKVLNINLNKLIKAYKAENTYEELQKLISNKEFDVGEYDRIVFIHGLVIHPDYRKLGVTEEFIEAMYRDYYADNVAIIGLVKPLQDNEIDADFYFRQKVVHIRKNFGITVDYDIIPAKEYYGLDKLNEKKDIESNEYRLFSVAARCGFQRIGNSHLFLFNPETIIERIIEKKSILDSKMPYNL